MSEYHRFGRNGSGILQRTRGVTCILTFLVLSISGFLFYLYLSASIELKGYRDQYRDQYDLNAKLKQEVLDLQVKMEKAKNSESDCRKSNEKFSALNNKLEACDSELNSVKSTLKIAESSLKSKDSSILQLKSELANSNDLLAKEKLECSKFENQTAIISGLDQKIQNLELELSNINSPNNNGSKDMLNRPSDNSTGTLLFPLSTENDDHHPHKQLDDEPVTNKTSEVGNINEEEQRAVVVAPLLSTRQEKATRKEELNDKPEKSNLSLYKKHDQTNGGEEGDGKVIVFKRPSLRDDAHEEANDENDADDDIDKAIARRTGGRVAIEEANARRHRLEQKNHGGEQLLKAVETQHEQTPGGAKDLLDAVAEGPSANGAAPNRKREQREDGIGDEQL